MLFIRSLINLLFVPLVTVTIYYHKRKKEMEADLSFIFVWGIVIVFNIILTRMITFAIRKLIGFNIEADSSYYTVVALVSAVLLPFIYDFEKRVLVWICLKIKKDF